MDKEYDIYTVEALKLMKSLEFSPADQERFLPKYRALVKRAAASKLYTAKDIIKDNLSFERGLFND